MKLVFDIDTPRMSLSLESELASALLKAIEKFIESEFDTCVHQCWKGKEELRP